MKVAFYLRIKRINSWQNMVPYIMQDCNCYFGPLRHRKLWVGKPNSQILLQKCWIICSQVNGGHWSMTQWNIKLGCVEEVGYLDYTYLHLIRERGTKLIKTPEKWYLQHNQVKKERTDLFQFVTDGMSPSPSGMSFFKAIPSYS